VEPGSMPRPLVQKKTWIDSLPIDMLLSALSFLVVAHSSSEIPEGLTNNPVYKTLIRSRSEVWTLSQTVEKMLNVSEKKVLKKVYGPVFVNGQWRSKYNHEIYKLYE
jgi:hypothetical protein